MLFGMPSLYPFPFLMIIKSLLFATRIAGSGHGHSACGSRQWHKKVSTSGVFQVFATLLRDSLIKKGILHAYSC